MEKEIIDYCRKEYRRIYPMRNQDSSDTKTYYSFLKMLKEYFDEDEIKSVLSMNQEAVNNLFDQMESWEHMEVNSNEDDPDMTFCEFDSWLADEAEN